MHLLSKLTSEICSKVGNLDRKTEQNRLKLPTLPSLLQTTVFIEKGKTLNDFLL